MLEVQYSSELSPSLLTPNPNAISLQVSGCTRSYISADSRIESENKLKRLLLAVMAIVATAATTNAQEYPKYEVYGTYSGVLADIDVSHATIKSHGLDGYGLGFQYNLAKYFGLVAEFTSNGSEGPIRDQSGTFVLTLDTRVNVLLFGPRFAYRTKHVTAFGHYLIGTASRKVGYDNVPSVNTTELAMGVGGGLDVNIGKHFAIRAVQFDYVPIHSGVPLNTGGGNWFRNFRYQGGVVFKF